MTFAENLKKLCKQNHTSPTAICKELGLSTSKVSAWYHGSLPKEKVMAALAQRLGCSVSDFFSETGSFVVSGDAALHSPLADKMQALDSIDKAKAEAYLDGLLAADKYHMP